ncbi:Undecaprenyl-phosphate alpha-N-acetylglucosaminyltransferase [Ignavibacterium album JCM 16511]|uniref:Undecaprenyl-phosphate alpha-N-acetylglucosaminyltransferase n=1 Tax=Ignavibacterium album (strain DSM 19864 / JCM 16511 / NBRC 101810 / Mat9-16) TaxID=945713 RepID=I0AJG0_IGNAJ|nr:MraY family glycosyltransferase [Ignavibacterium album]AFH49117.1 Undecaprenyl-phosphate alpha-N-acetylglucosaminyltransferase [Ignavibacterium album JCM 16511]
MLFLISVFFSFIAVVFATPLFANLLSSLEIVDHPDSNRKIHSQPTPRMGGVIIYSVVILFLIFLFPFIYEFKFFLIGSLILFILGVADDLWNLKWSVKFTGQGIAALLLMLYLIKHNYFQFNFIGISISPFIALPLMFFFIVGTLNAFNLLDGMDGLVSGFSLIIGSLSFLLSFNSESFFVPLLSILIIGTTLGFLKFNGNPASIFLGDSGSLVLGYFCLTALLSSASEASNHTIDLVFVGMVLSVPLLDTLRVMLCRIIKGKNPFLPDKNHLHHIIYSKKIRHKTTVFIILALTIISVLIALYYKFSSAIAGISLFILFSIILLSINKLLDFILKKENLLLYGRIIKSLPNKMAVVFKFYILPIVTFLIFSFLTYLLFSRVSLNDKRMLYLLLFNFLTMAYIFINLKSKNYISDFFVFVNFVMFFYTTDAREIFYRLYQVPIFNFINLNQLFIILVVPVIIFYFLFRDKLVDNYKEETLAGVDLILALAIVSNYLFIKFSGIAQEYYFFADILIRSFLVYLLYKIIVGCFPKLRFQLYFTSYIIVIIALLRIIVL